MGSTAVRKTLHLHSFKIGICVLTLSQVGFLTRRWGRKHGLPSVPWPVGSGGDRNWGLGLMVSSPSLKLPMWEMEEGRTREPGQRW